MGMGLDLGFRLELGNIDCIVVMEFHIIMEQLKGNNDGINEGTKNRTKNRTKNGTMKQ